MHRRFVRAAALSLGVLLLAGCTGMPGADVESLLRAPRLSGEASAVQKALNSYLGSVATLKYPATGEFLSPFAFGDWDGDGTEEAAVLYTAEETIQEVNRQTYTNMLLADMTGRGDGIQDLVLALPTEGENAGINLQLLTYTGGDTFLAAQTLAVGQGVYSGCAGLQAGQGADDATCLVLDGWTGSGANSLVSSIILYDPESGFLKTYTPPGVTDLYRATLRYDLHLLSTDINGDGTIDIPTEVSDGGELAAAMESRLRFLLWKDYATAEGGNNIFGVYDSEYRFFLQLPESMHGNVLLRGAADNGWIISNLAGTTNYCELRIVDPAEQEEEDNAAGRFYRVANIGGRQLQVRMLTDYYGLQMQDIINGVTVLQ